jgi:hypothetical protein
MGSVRFWDSRKFFMFSAVSIGVLVGIAGFSGKAHAGAEAAPLEEVAPLGTCLNCHNGEFAISLSDMKQKYRNLKSFEEAMKSKCWGITPDTDFKEVFKELKKFQNKVHTEKKNVAGNSAGTGGR